MEIGERIKAFIATNFFLGGSEEISCSQSLLASGVMDSTGIMELIMFVEETFGISIPDEDLVPEHFDSIERITEYVTGMVATCAAARVGAPS